MSQLKSMIQDLINGRKEQAEVALHNFVVTKTQAMIGEAKGEVNDLPANLKSEVVKLKGYKGFKSDVNFKNVNVREGTFSVFFNDNTTLEIHIKVGAAFWQFDCVKSAGVEVPIMNARGVVSLQRAVDTAKAKLNGKEEPKFDNIDKMREELSDFVYDAQGPKDKKAVILGDGVYVSDHPLVAYDRLDDASDAAIKELYDAACASNVSYFYTYDERGGGIEHAVALGKAKKLSIKSFDTYAVRALKGDYDYDDAGNLKKKSKEMFDEVAAASGFSAALVKKAFMDSSSVLMGCVKSGAKYLIVVATND